MTDENQDRDQLRLDRQFRFFGRQIPAARRPLRAIRHPWLWMVRLPVALFLIAGGFLAVLPVFGLWMIPLGLLLLAIDVPHLRGPVAGGVVRGRQWLRSWRRPSPPTV